MNIESEFLNEARKVMNEVVVGGGGGLWSEDAEEIFAGETSIVELTVSVEGLLALESLGAVVVIFVVVLVVLVVVDAFDDVVVVAVHADFVVDVDVVVLESVVMDFLILAHKMAVVFCY